MLAGACRLLSQHDQIRDQALDPAYLHLKRIAEDRFENTAALPRRAHGTLGHDDVILLDHSCNPHGRTAGERFILDFPVERFLTGHMKCAGYYPLHVITQAGKDLGMITSIEAIDIALDGTLVRAHALYPDDCDEAGAILAAPKSLAILLAH